ncbi:MAG: c-type cytochrome [Gemmatimonadota bacterium]
MSAYCCVISRGLRGKPGLLLVALFALASPACQQAAPTDDVLATLDSALTELGGIATTDLTRSQRWRMISSIGAGLPPASFDVTNLPEAHSRGAGLLTAYCVQCHGIPTPKMHAAAEWPILIRRMTLRAATLRDRMGGPLTRELVGEVRMSGFASSYVPSPADMDTLVSYLQRNALPVVQVGELGNDPDARFYARKCSICHETPSPAAHSGPDWVPILSRMQTNMAAMDVAPLDEADRNRITAFLVGG